jgi:predicted nucleotidyltransferase
MEGKMGHKMYNLSGDELPPSRLRPIKRKTAEKNVQDMLDTARRMNSEFSSTFTLLSVSRIWGFGSFFFSDRDPVGDIDICAEFIDGAFLAAARLEGGDAFRELCDDFAGIFGPPSLDWWGRMNFHERHAKRLLRGGKPHIKLHYLYDIEDFEKTLIFEMSDAERVAQASTESAAKAVAA